jgi:hypothetical protein
METVTLLSVSGSILVYLMTIVMAVRLKNKRAACR